MFPHYQLMTTFLESTPHIQVSDVLCYKLIPIIYRTSLLQNSLKVIALFVFTNQELWYVHVKLV